MGEGVWWAASGNVWVMFVEMGVEGGSKVRSKPRRVGWYRSGWNGGGEAGPGRQGGEVSVMNVGHGVVTCGRAEEGGGGTFVSSIVTNTCCVGDNLL